MIFQTKAKILEKDRTLSEREFWPQVFLQTSYGYGESDYLGPHPLKRNATEYTGMLVVNFNLWSWGGQQKKIEAESYKVAAEESNAQKAWVESREICRRLQIELRKYAEEVNFRMEIFSSEEKSFESVKRDYRSGKSSFLDFISSMDNYINSQVDFQFSFFKYLETLATLHFHRGTIYDQLGKKP